MVKVRARGRILKVGFVLSFRIVKVGVVLSFRSTIMVRYGGWQRSTLGSGLVSSLEVGARFWSWPTTGGVRERRFERQPIVGEGQDWCKVQVEIWVNFIIMHKLRVRLTLGPRMRVRFRVSIWPRDRG